MEDDNVENQAHFKRYLSDLREKMFERGLTEEILDEILQDESNDSSTE